MYRFYGRESSIAPKPSQGHPGPRAASPDEDTRPAPDSCLPLPSTLVPLLPLQSGRAHCHYVSALLAPELADSVLSLSNHLLR